MSNKQQSSIDDKLKKILFDYGEGKYNGNLDAGVKKTKQAFADENYVQIPLVVLEPYSNLTVNGKKVMTGPQWYEKFRIEFRKLAPKSYAKDFYVKKAAQNAAGIKDD